MRGGIHRKSLKKCLVGLLAFVWLGLLRTATFVARKLVIKDRVPVQTTSAKHKATSNTCSTYLGLALLFLRRERRGAVARSSSTSSAT